MRNYAPLYAGSAAVGKSLATQGGTEQDNYQKTLGDMFRQQSQQAHAGLYEAQAERERYRLDNQRSGRNTFLQAQTGLDDSQLGDIARAAKHGWGQIDAEGPPTTPAWFTPQVKDKYNQARTTLSLNDVATGDTNASQLANAMNEIMKQGYGQKIVEGQEDPGSVAAAFAAMAGKPTVDVTGSGIAFNPYGDKNDLNTTPFIDKANIDAGAKENVATIKGDSGTNSQKKYQELKQMGVPDQIALGSAYGMIKSVHDPATGATVLVDINTGRSVGRLRQADPANFRSPFEWESYVQGQQGEPAPSMTREQLEEQANKELKDELGWKDWYTDPSENEITQRAVEITKRASGGKTGIDRTSAQPPGNKSTQAANKPPDPPKPPGVPANARYGHDESGNPGWYVPDPSRPGKHMRLRNK